MSFVDNLVPKIIVAMTRFITRLQAVNYKRLALGLYGTVIALVLGAMVYLLNMESQTMPTDQSSVTIIAAESIEGIIAAFEGEGQVSVAIEDIETILPLPAEKPVWQQNAANWVTEAENPRIAIVIDDVGLSYETSMLMKEMTAPLTLSFLPYAEFLPEQTRALKLAGHELMVHMPMEPKLKDADPGPNALLSGLNVDEFERRVVWNLTQFEGFVGINNHMGSLLTEQPAAMVRVMVHLRRGGLLFLDSLTSSKSVAARAAKATGVPYTLRDVFLDNKRNVKDILVQLALTEKIARQKGYAVAIGHPYDETLKALEFWMASLGSKKLTLVPLSQIIVEQQKALLTANLGVSND